MVERRIRRCHGPAAQAVRARRVMLRLTLLSAISTACGPSPLDTPDIALARHEQSRACAAYRPHRARPETEVLVASQLGVIGAQPPAVVLLDNAFDLMRVCVVTAGVWIRATRPARLPTLAPRAQRMMSQFAVPNGAGTRHELAHVKALLAKSPEPPRRRSFTVDWASRRSERRERTMRGVRLCRASMVERRACPDGSAWPLDVTAGLHFRQREEVAAFRAVFAIVEDAFDLVCERVVAIGGMELHALRRYRGERDSVPSGKGGHYPVIESALVDERAR